MKKGHYLYLGIAITYVSLACIQLCKSEMLPTAIYSYVAWASFELTFLELIKSLSHYFQAFSLDTIRITEDELRLCERHIETFEKHPKLSAELAFNKKKHEEIEKGLKELRKKKDAQYLGKAVDIITVLQIMFCFIQLAIYSTIKIPDNYTTNKVNGVLSLLSFAFLFVAYYLNP